MIPGAMSYPAIRDLIDQRYLVVFAPGSVNGDPCCAWLATPLRATFARNAYDDDQTVRMAQIVGATLAVREHFAAYGFVGA
jgi:hypothetical protein